MIGFESVAGYRIRRVLGEGGMGRVYEAVQTEPVRRRVALKVLRPGGGSGDVAARFAAEQQVLAMMDHPGIAKVFDAGVTEDGRQWFAMELVEGQELTVFADRAQLDVAARVELFAGVCRAVQHAHQKGVIHRDLKPSNVLVAAGDRGPAPKVIDFGVAKALDLRLTDETLVTQFGSVIGTPAYMSPEQAGGTTLDIDTRSDVYSLGVLLYELLVGRLPVDPAETGYPGFIAYLKRPDTTPPTPRDRFTTLDIEEQRRAAAMRETSPSRLREQLGGDLGWIVMTALEKERGRRYESAGSLARDLERYRRREPVTARPPSRSYQLRKFVSRNRVAVTAAAAVVVALSVGATAATVGMVRARREAAIAQREALTAERVSWFMASLFTEADPEFSRGRDITMREMLDRAPARIEAELADEPAVQARLLRGIGQAYQGLGSHAQARPLLERSLELFERLGGYPLDVAALQHDLGYSLTFLSEFEAADSLLRASLDTHLEAEGGHGTDWTTVIVTNLAFNALRWGRGVAAADSLLAATRPIQVERLGEDHRRVAMASYLRCWTLRDLGHRLAADSACAASLELMKRSMGDDAPGVVYNLLNAGHTRLALGRLGDAREAYDSAASLNRRLHGDSHSHTAYALLGIADVLVGQGRPDSALAYARDGVDMLHRTMPGSTELARGRSVLARTLAELGRLDEAEAVLDGVLATDSALMGVESQRYATHLAQLGEVRLRQGALDDGRRMTLRAVRILERAEPPESIRLMDARLRAGMAARRAGAPSSAEPLLRAALARTETSPADLPLERAEIQTELALTLLERGEGDPDGETCRLATGAGAVLADVLGGDHWRSAWSRSVIGLCHVHAGDLPAGERELRDGVAGLRASRRPADLHRREAESWLASDGVRLTARGGR